MATTKITRLGAALTLMALSATASANFITLSPSGQIVGSGTQVSLDLYMDFVDTTVGGAFDVFYDAGLLSFVSFEFDAGFLASVADPAFSAFPDNCIDGGSAGGGCADGDAELNGIGFGNFDGITGNHLIGTLTFDALQNGLAVLTMATNDAPWEGFISASDASELVVLYTPAKVRIIPVPAAAWLLGSALLMIAGLRRRRR